MSLEKNRPSGIDILKLKKMKIDEILITETPSPSVITAKKRVSKLTNRKTNEQLIKESHDQLMDYAGSINQKVQRIIELYEAEFIEAYREHVKKVREEMEDLKKKSQNNSCSQDKFMDKIDVLQKQLVLFREDSLHSYEKVMKKDKQLGILTVKLKDVEKELHQKQKIIFNLSKRNKELEVLIDQFKNKYEDFGKQVLKEQEARFSKSQNKNYKDLYSPLSKHLLIDPDQSRPFSTQIKSARPKNFSLGFQSQKKVETIVEREQMKQIKQKLFEKGGETQMVSISAVLDIITENKINRAEFERGKDFKKSRSNYMARIQAKRSSNFLFDCQELKKKSKELSEVNELRNIFKDCIQEVRADMAKRKGIPSLNFFKQNGPKSYQDFKKLDLFALMELFIGNETILKQFYELMFNIKQ